MPGVFVSIYKNLIMVLYNEVLFGDDRLRRERLNPNGEPRGTDLVKSVQKTSANRTNYATLPLAA
jgi:hypothetical protein